MPLSSLLKTSTSTRDVMNGADGDAGKPGVSDFLTLQSFTNFAAMSGAITAAWHAAAAATCIAKGIWFPYGCAMRWAIISYLISRDGLQQGGKVPLGVTLQALFIGFINAMVLAGSVVGSASVLSTMKQG